jgi:hypothetical protein
MNAKLWESLELAHEGIWCGRFGGTCLWLKRREDELHVAAQREQDQIPPSQALAPGQPPDDETLAWRRWVISQKANRLRLAPAMPDRSVVVRPEQPVTLPPKVKAEFFVRVPLWLRLLVSRDGDQESVLCEEPALTLSNTWFGDTMSGELCYSMKTTARRHVEPDSLAPYRAICPVTVTNDSNEDLLIERICVRVAHLRIYEADGILWTGRVSAGFHGADHASKLTYHRSAPSHAPGARQITEERQPANQSVFRRTFLSLRSVIA